MRARLIQSTVMAVPCICGTVWAMTVTQSIPSFVFYTLATAVFIALVVANVVRLFYLPKT